MEVTPANPFAADDIWLDVEGVVPHEIPEDYTVDWETCTAYCPDDVVFAMRFGDTSGRWTEARTDTFAYDVPVHWISAPWFTVIRPWSCSPVLAGFMLTKSRRSR